MTKILLVEDDKSLREIYGVRLQAEGYEIIAVGDGEEALALSIKERPALILSDVMMPKISGFDMLDILRSTTETRDIKVIMMTALSSEDQRERGERLGADRYLVKSQVGIEDVVRTVHEVLGDMPSMARPTVNTQSVAPAAVVASTPSSAPASQPIAPAPPEAATTFSAGLGERIIQPISVNNDQQASDLAALMSQELGEVVPPAMLAPTQSSVTPPTPDPVMTVPQPQSYQIPSMPPTPSQPAYSPAAPTAAPQPTPVTPAYPSADASQTVAPQPAPTPITTAPQIPQPAPQVPTPYVAPTPTAVLDPAQPQPASSTASGLPTHPIDQ